MAATQSTAKMNDSEEIRKDANVAASSLEVATDEMSSDEPAFVEVDNQLKQQQTTAPQTKPKETNLQPTKQRRVTFDLPNPIRNLQSTPQLSSPKKILFRSADNTPQNIVAMKQKMDNTSDNNKYNINQYTSKIEQLQAIIQSYSQEIARYKQDVDTQQTIIADLETKQATLEIDNKQANEFIKELTQTIQQLKQNQKESEQKSVGSSEKTDELQKKLEQVTNHKKELQLKIKEMKLDMEKITSFKTKISNLEKILDNSRTEQLAEVTLLKQNAAQKEMELRAEFDEKLKNEIKKQQYIYDTNLEQQTGKQKEYYEAKMEKLKQSCDLELEKSVKSNIKETMDHYQAVYDNDLKEKDAQLDKLQTKYNDMILEKQTELQACQKNLNQQFKQKMSEIEQRHSQQLAMMNDDFKQSQSTNLKLHQTILDLKHDLKGIAQLLKDEKLANNKLQDQIECKHQELQHIHAIVDKQKQLITQLQKQNNSHSDEIEILNQKINQLTQMKNKLQKKYDTQCNALDSEKVLVGQMKNENTQLTLENQMAKENINILQNQMEKISKKLSDEQTKNKTYSKQIENYSDRLKQKESKWNSKEERYMDTIESLQRQLSEISTNSMGIMDQLSMIRNDVRLKVKELDKAETNNAIVFKLNSALAVSDKVTMLLKDLISAEYQFCFRNVNQTISATKDYQCVLNQRKEMEDAISNGWQYSKQELENELFILIKENQNLLQHYIENAKCAQQIKNDLADIIQLIQATIQLCGFQPKLIEANIAHHNSETVIRNYASNM